MDGFAIFMILIFGVICGLCIGIFISDHAFMKIQKELAKEHEENHEDILDLINEMKKLRKEVKTFEKIKTSKEVKKEVERSKNNESTTGEKN